MNSFLFSSKISLAFDLKIHEIKRKKLKIMDTVWVRRRREDVAYAATTLIKKKEKKKKIFKIYWSKLSSRQGSNSFLIKVNKLGLNQVRNYQNGQIFLKHTFIQIAKIRKIDVLGSINSLI